MVTTRSLETAKNWLRGHADEEQRSGLLASAEARRLRAWGIDTKTLREDRGWADWYLRPRGDVRSSNQLELPATNFDWQGLEIDWAGICWGNDLIPDSESGTWTTRRFLGTRWTTANAERRQYILNGYRVLLTRARRGQVIWVPKPDGSDSTYHPLNSTRSRACSPRQACPRLTDTCATPAPAPAAHTRSSPTH